MTTVALVVPILAILSAPAVTTSHLRSPASAALEQPASNTKLPATPLGLPDGAGGQYMLWSEVRDGSFDLFLLRVTNEGTPATGWPAGGLVVCDAPGDQREGALFSDGADGVVVGWLDGRDDWLMGDAYAQRVSPAGVPQWTANGVQALEGTAQIEDIGAAPDGEGGLVVVWTQSPTGLSEDLDVYATRITGAGVIAPGWGAGGVVVCDQAQEQGGIAIIGDGSGGALIAWEDHRSPQVHVYAQYLDAAGDPQWTSNGIPIDASTLGATSPTLLLLDIGEPLVTWFDNDGSSMRAQRIDWTGAGQWTTAAVLHPGGGPGSPTGESQSVPDGLGGAIVAWQSFDAGYSGCQAQRVDANGTILWGVSGATVVTGPVSFGGEVDLINDGVGGAFFAWTEFEGDADDNIYARRVTPAGNAIWGATGVPVCTYGGRQRPPHVAPDGSGGLLVCWSDFRSGDEEIYTQRLSSVGDPQLDADGKATYVNPGVQGDPQVFWMPDGGVLVAWEEKRNGEYDIRARKFNDDGSAAGPATIISDASGRQALIGMTFSGPGVIVSWWDEFTNAAYAQRLDANAVPQWTPNGAPVCPSAVFAGLPHMVSDQAGGALFTWADNRGSSPDIYAQRVTSVGIRPWGADGVALAVTGFQAAPVLTSDGAGGAIVAWLDTRNAPNEIFAQRINGNGNALWTPGGLLVASVSSPNGSISPADIVAGTERGAIVLIHEAVYDPVAADYSSGLYAQKVDSLGAARWGTAGTLLLDHTGSAAFVHMVDDGAGGAYVGWSDDRNGRFDIYAQHVDADGNAWGVGGNAVCDLAGWQNLGGISRLANGDLLLAWADDRSGFPDVYAHRIDVTGAEVWPADGVVVSDAPRGQFSVALSRWRMTTPEHIYVAWTDNRAGDERLVYTERLDLNGASQWSLDGVTSTQIALVSAEADPHRVRLNWYGAEDIAANVYRRTGQSDWTMIASLASDGTGRLVFEDREVEPGIRYGYRLGVRDRGEEVFLGETWIDVPNTLVLALHGLTPNPAIGALVVGFTLPRGDAATLEMLDPAGRRVQSHELTGLAPGRHTLRLGSAPAPGVYFLRLTQNDQSVTARAAVIH